MNDTKTTNQIVSTKLIREGLLQVEYDHGYTLSIGFGPGHYSTKLFGEHIPNSYEVAVLDPNGDFVRLTDADDVAGHVSIEDLERIKYRMGYAHFDPRDLELYFE